MVSVETPPERPPPHKATLYCPDCDHSNRINGDWIIDVQADHVEYECPACGTTIASRPGKTALTAGSGGSLLLGNGD